MNQQADDLDTRISELLRRDPTIQNSQISEEVGVSNATTGTRIKRLQDDGMLRVVASTDIRAAGYNVVALVTLELNSKEPDTGERVATQLAQYPQVIAIGEMLHQEQIIFNMLGRDPADIEEQLVKISTIEEISLIHLRFYLKFLKNSLNTGPIHDLGASIASRMDELSSTNLAKKYNERELKVLAALHRDGRMSLRQVANQLDIPESQVRASVRKFQNTPGILDYQTLIDPRMHGNQHACFLLMRVNHAMLAQAVAELKPLPDVTQLTTITGRKNLAAVISVKERADLQTIVNTNIRANAGIKDVEVIDLTASYKYEGSWNIPIFEEV